MNPVIRLGVLVEVTSGLLKGLQGHVWDVRTTPAGSFVKVFLHDKRFADAHEFWACELQPVQGRIAS